MPDVADRHLDGKAGFGKRAFEAEVNDLTVGRWRYLQVKPQSAEEGRPEWEIVVEEEYVRDADLPAEALLLVPAAPPAGVAHRGT